MQMANEEERKKERVKDETEGKGGDVRNSSYRLQFETLKV